MSDQQATLSAIAIIDQVEADSTRFGTTIATGDIVAFAADGLGALAGDGVSGRTIVSGALALITLSNANMVGAILRCVSAANATSAPNVGLERQVVQYTTATGTCVCDLWPARTQIGDTFVIVSTGAPVIAEDTGGSAVQLEDANHDTALEPDDHWNGSAYAGGPYVWCRQVTNTPETTLRLITDYTNVGGIFTVGLAGNSAIGDLAKIVCCPECTGEIKCTEDKIARSSMGRFEGPFAVRGLRKASGTLEFQARGSGPDRQGLLGEIGRFLGCGLADVSAVAGVPISDLTAGAGGTTVSVAYGAGTAYNGRVYVSASGDAFVCADTTAAPATPFVPSPSLRIPIVNASTIRGLRTWHPSDVARRLMTIYQWWSDGIFEEIYGCAPSWELEWALGQPMKYKMAVQGSDYYRVHCDDLVQDLVRAFRLKRPTIAPLMSSGGRLVYAGVEMEVENATVNIGPGYATKGAVGAPNHNAGFRHATSRPTFKIAAKVAAENKRWIEDAASGDRSEGTSLSIQEGSIPGKPGVHFWWAHDVQLKTLDFTGGDGVVTMTAEGEVIDHDTDSSFLPCWLLAQG
ncbi:hypothetical protein [Zavarzinia sp.]|uniref:hypothetical protein n=1 Tax=Zavarzinia sp. TaxID=2027920 RepID=UPI0035628C51